MLGASLRHAGRRPAKVMRASDEARSIAFAIITACTGTQSGGNVVHMQTEQMRDYGRRSIRNIRGVLLLRHLKNRAETPSKSRIITNMT
ncbi:hypothetical protein C7E20_18420 [Sphingobium sp. AEW4]|nr:hypothetical protein C7E20_18420 [Sphingobium sp. AEW4]